MSKRVWKYSKSHRENLSKSHIGIFPSPKTRRKMSIAQKLRIRKPHSKETKRKMSIAKVGCIPWNKGIKFSFESRIKMSLATVGKRWGSRNPNWQGGKSFELYTPSFNQQTKERVRVRDNFICQSCGVPELELSRKLHVHHIDYNKKNSSINNLISLCHTCHGKTNSNRNLWIKKFEGVLQS